jgi:hypothetical protein
VSAAGARYMGLIAQLACVICRRFPEQRTGLPTEVHHVAEGSSKRSDFATVPLCGNQVDGGHHRGGSVLGFHGSPETFLRVFRPPFENEYGLLAWTAQDLAAQFVDYRRAA